MKIMQAEGIKRKPVRITDKCDKMLREAMAYIACNSKKQAEMLYLQFAQILNILEILPEIGTVLQKRDEENPAWEI